MRKSANLVILGAISLFALSACATKPEKVGAWPANNKANQEANANDANANETPNSGQMVDSAAAPAPYVVGESESAASARNGNKTILGIVDVGDRVYFQTDSFSLTAQARDILAKQAHFLMARPNTKVLIAGNCDERGTREYNIALGARRANSARDYLVSLGVNSGQIETVSYGKERPIDERPSAEGWAINRNAQTKVQ